MAGVRLSLPSLVLSPADLSRLRREVKSLDNYLEAQKVREPGVPVDRLPKVSRLLNDLAEGNKLNLLHETVRQELTVQLDDLLAHAPIVHLSFAADPSAASLQEIVVWLRQNIRADVLIRVGLQPNIAAGCVMRTTNRYFDFSLRHYLSTHRQYLLEALAPPSKDEAAT